ncbi:unnamed protein product [Caenorhabditis brenneri]
MASRPRRGTAATLIKKEVKKEEDDVQVVEDDDDVDEDEGPPPLEREASCGENDDTDGETKEGDNESMTPNDLKEDDGVDSKNTINLLEALSSVFNTDSDKKKKGSPPILDAGSLKFLSSTPLPTRSAAIPKALLLKKNSNSMPSTSSSNRPTNLRPMNSNESKKYGVPPPIPQALRNIAANLSTAPVVGSNTSLGPARLLENRKRQNDRGLEAGSSKRPSGLVAYNGGRAGEKFQTVPTTSSKSSGTATPSAPFDVSSFLRNQSPVRMQVSVGGEHDNGDSMQQAFEMAAIQKETIGNIAKASTNQSILLGSLVLNGLNTLQNRSSEEYNSFVGDLFSLITKYKIQ